MLAGYTVSVPNCLSAGPDQLERLYRAVAAAAMYTLNLRAVSFVWPWGVVGLVLGARVLVTRSGHGRCASRRMAPGAARARAFGLSGPHRASGAQARRSA